MVLLVHSINRTQHITSRETITVSITNQQNPLMINNKSCKDLKLKPSHEGLENVQM